jgi:dipeptidyl aminopeptidase/acylaminoacyl peptidase
MPKRAPYGCWASPITADVVAAGALKLSDITLDGGTVYWIETRPEQAGRNAIVAAAADGGVRDAIPPEFNARTRVHEYGGGSFCASGGMVCFAHYPDQRLYLVRGSGEPLPLNAGANCRYADGVFDLVHARTIWVEEDHSGGGEPSNSLVGIGLAGDAPPQVLVGGRDFFSSPRLSPDGKSLAWLCWDHPNMPWDGTELWIARVSGDGTLKETSKVAGSTHESICQPEWSPDGDLYFVSDRTGWWNIYRFKDGHTEAALRSEAEFARPAWVFGLSSFGFPSPDRIVASFCRSGLWHLCQIDVPARQLETVDCPFTEISYLRVCSDFAALRGGAPSEPACVARLDIAAGTWSVLKRSTSQSIDGRYLSLPERIEFPTSSGRTAHACFYRPVNHDFAAAPGERPPLIVKVHGGPTSATDTTFRLDIQFWTTRGFAVADVNYGGSTGFGKEYRQRLDKQWGVVDVDDCVNAALYLADRGEVDGKRMAISGSSAGGFTTLSALAFRDVFAAGASYYGIADLVSLASTTHKFESHYSDRLIGELPDALEVYKSRSPLNFADWIKAPVIFFQGLDDRVVTPDQTESMARALAERSVPVACLLFQGEGHGFRKADTIRKALEAELYFYRRIFDLPSSEPLATVHIANL